MPDSMLRQFAPAILAIAFSAARAHAPDILLEGRGDLLSTAAVDGFEGSEWANAGSVSFTAASPDGTLPGVTLLVMNNGSNLSIGLRIPGWSEVSYLLIHFDSDHDGVCQQFEDGIWMESPFPDTFYDSFNSTPGCAGDLAPDPVGGQGTGTTDGSGYVQTYGAPSPHTFFEAVHPLNSADAAYDFHLHGGARIGFSLRLGVCHTNYIGCVVTTFPAAAVGDISLSPLFANGFQ